MRNPLVILANDFHHDTPLVRLSYEKDPARTDKQFLRNGNSKTTRTFAVGIHFPIRRGFQNAMFSNWAEICFSKKELGKIINPLHDFG
ncbi:hypothetical protein EOM75_07370 [Candidatus Falkowbacteria bacterium]|jgi:hypothetical protein|nr:hypothetical protein [Bacteroidales bacterium]NCU35824.1 hypothetical protein [Candidatus Falkowbacteria bacterium]